MIFYFSATGNSKYVASQITSQTNEDIISITDCIKNNQFIFDVKPDERIGFITPTYFWGLPLIVNDFLSQVKFSIQGSDIPYIYHIATYGTTTGQSGRFVNNYLRKAGLSLSGRFCVKMPDTWTPMFDLSNKEKVERINQNAEKEIEEVTEKIKHRQKGDFSRGKIPLLFVKIYYPFYEKYRKTKNFTVEYTCIGCELCAKKCPVGAIEMQNNRPVWVKSKCIICLGCLHHCPKFSIQYGKNTKKHGQYINPNVK
jgi:Pyruvate/2-oxoacid:ferredoxin oxidoreductase delta subunit/flavodoxin